MRVVSVSIYLPAVRLKTRGVEAFLTGAGVASAVIDRGGRHCTNLPKLKSV